MKKEELNGLHKSVLLEELVENIKIFIDKKNIVVDCTLGLAGHAKELIKKLNSGDIFIGFDADIRNLSLAKEVLSDCRKDIEMFFICSNFVNIKEELNKLGIYKISGVYYDLGISSLHVDEAERGFSFKLDGPLDMRFDTTKGKSAAYILNTYREEDLKKIFLNYGEEAKSFKIAREIVKKRKTRKFETTKDLSELIESVTKFPKTKNKIFQALRIEVNRELENIEKSIKDSINLLESGGSIFVISFHSLEDRIIKNIFREESKDCICKDIICSCKHKKTLKIITKKPIIPTNQEIKINPRSRSAKARLAIKI